MSHAAGHWIDDQAPMPSPEGRSFLLDTNVLLHDADSLSAFGNHNLVLTVDVLEELDRFKRENDERGRNARRVIRTIDELRQRHTFRIVSTLDDEGLEEIKAIFRVADVKILRRKLMKKAGFYYSEWYASGPRLEQKDVVRKLLDNKHVQELTY